MASFRPLVLAIALLVPLASSAEEEVEAVAAVAPQHVPHTADDIEAFRSARDRFRQRVEELEAEVHGQLEARLSAERQGIREAYSPLIDELMQRERDQRALAIERSREFLERYPDAPYASHVRFRLADLLWQHSKDEHTLALDAYHDLEDRLLAEGRVDELPEYPELDLSVPIALCEQVIADNAELPPETQYEHLYAVYYALGQLYRDVSLQRDPEQARVAFEALVSLAPESELADDAHLHLGDYFAEESTDHDRYDRAVHHFMQVYERGPEGHFYLDAGFRLGWTHHRFYEYQSALDLFAEILDLSEEEQRATGRGLDFAPDALRSIAYAIADIAQADFREPLDVITEYFDRIGQRPWERQVYVQLAEVLVRYAEREQAIGIFRQLQDDPRWGHRPENPEYQYMVVAQHRAMAFPDSAAIAAAWRELIDRYGEGSDWWRAHNHRPDVQAAARLRLESAMEMLAMEALMKADSSQSPADAAIAADRLREYLDAYPIADNYYRNTLYLADAESMAERHREAALAYESLYRSRRHHEFGDTALWWMMMSRNHVVRHHHGPPDRRPPHAVLERRVTTPAGQELEVYALTNDHKRFIEAADLVLRHEWGPPAEDDEDYAAEVAEQRAMLMYLPGQIFFYHGRFEEARPRLYALIDQHPRTEEAAWAARLIVDSHQEEGDRSALTRALRRFRGMQLGPDEAAVTAETERIFDNILEETVFMGAMSLLDEARNVDAAEAFLAFVDEFPDSQHLPSALISAAAAYERAGRLGRANDLLEVFVNRFPEHERAPGIFSRIAVNYGSAFELDRAIHYYGELVRRFPDHPTAPDAQFNIALLHSGLKNHLAAAQAYEEYARRYPGEEDALEVMFTAGVEYEQADVNQAIRFYQRFIQAYGEQNPDYLVESKYRMAQLYLQQGNTRQHRRMMDELRADFDRHAAREHTFRAQARRAAAESAYQTLKADLERVTNVQVGGRNIQRDMETATRHEEPVGEFRVRAVEAASAYQDPDHLLGFIVLGARALLSLSELGLSVTPPRTLSDSEFFVWEDQLIEHFYPVFEEFQGQAVTELESVIRRARCELDDVEQRQRCQRRHNEWVEEAYSLLNRLQPDTYPALKQELRGQVDAAPPSEVRPVKVPDLEEGQ